MKSTTVLMFDLGGVLVEISAFDSLASMLNEELDRDALRERWLRSPVVRALELGQIPPEEFAARFVAEWPISLTPEAFLTEFASWVRGPYPGAIELLTRLREDYYVSCLSNSNPVHWSQLSTFLTSFDSAFSSHLLGEIKPDRETFSTVLRRLGVDAAAIRFFDDSRANVDAARSLGMAACLVEGYDHLRELLDREGTHERV